MHQAALTQQAEMVGHQVLRLAGQLGQLGHLVIAACQLAEQPPPQRMPGQAQKIRRIETAAGGCLSMPHPRIIHQSGRMHFVSTVKVTVSPRIVAPHPKCSQRCRLVDSIAPAGLVTLGRTPRSGNVTAPQPSDPDDPVTGHHPPTWVSLGTIMAQWTRIGITGFGGPPAHISLLRQLCVTKRGWINAQEFEDGIAATNLLPGPASTQLAIFCAWRLRGWAGGLLGGVCFIVPGLIVILGLSVLLLSGHPAPAVIGAAAGAGAAVAAVAVQAGASLVPASWQRTGTTRVGRVRWVAYAVAAAVAAMLLGPWLVLVLLAAGVVEATFQGHRPRISTLPSRGSRWPDGVRPGSSDRWPGPR